MADAMAPRSVTLEMLYARMSDQQTVFVERLTQMHLYIEDLEQRVATQAKELEVLRAAVIAQ